VTLITPERPEEEVAFYTLPELAAYLRVPEETLRGWRKDGKGPRAAKMGRHLRYDRRDVAEWIERQKQKAS
jgi:excisionase family DNA binding protein